MLPDWLPSISCDRKHLLWRVNSEPKDEEFLLLAAFGCLSASSLRLPIDLHIGHERHHHERSCASHDNGTNPLDRHGFESALRW